MPSWPFLFTAAFAIWLFLKGPAAKTSAFVQNLCRIAIVFLVYCAFLYLLKWDAFWTWMPFGFENRNTAEGFLILVSTIVWLVATFRIAFRGLRFRRLRAGSVGLESRSARQEANRSGLSLKNIAIFHYFFYFFSRK